VRASDNRAGLPLVEGLAHFVDMGPRAAR